MNYVIEFAEMENGAWIAGKYQVMSAGSIQDLTDRFYQENSRETHRIERAVWWNPPGIRHEAKRKRTHEVA